jgi:hypothetical protein
LGLVVGATLLFPLSRGDRIELGIVDDIYGVEFETGFGGKSFSQHDLSLSAGIGLAMRR